MAVAVNCFEIEPMRKRVSRRTGTLAFKSAYPNVCWYVTRPSWTNAIAMPGRCPVFHLFNRSSNENAARWFCALKCKEMKTVSAKPSCRIMSADYTLSGSDRKRFFGTVTQNRAVGELLRPLTNVCLL